MKFTRSYQWVSDPPYKCDLCRWHIDTQPALKMGEYTLCSTCAEEQLVAAGLAVIGGLAALAQRDGVQIQYKEEQHV